MRRLLLLLSTLASTFAMLVTACPRPGSAAPMQNQTANRPVCTLPGDQIDPRIVADLAGGAIVIWEDDRTGSGDLYALHLLASGEVDPAWPSGGRALCTAEGTQTDARAVSDGAGGAIVTWEDGRGTGRDIYAQHVLASGELDARWPPDGAAVCTALGDQRSPTIDSDGGSGAIIAWEDGRDNEVDLDVYARRILEAGIVDPVWPPEGLWIARSSTNLAGGASPPRIVADGANGALVVIGKLALDPLGAPGAPTTACLLALHVLAGAVVDPAWPPEGVFVGHQTSDPQVETAAASDGAGGLFTASADPGNYRVNCLRLLASGATSWVGAMGGTMHTVVKDPVIAADGHGGAVVACEGYDYRDPPPWTYHISAVSLPAQMYGVRPRSASRPQVRPAVCSDGAGGLIVAWEDVPSVSESGSLYVQHVLATGEMDPECPSGGRLLSESSTMVAAIADGVGGAVLAWQEHHPGTGWDIMATRLLGPRPTGTLATLVSAEPAVGSVRLTWSCGDEVGRSASIHRSSEGDEWMLIGAGRIDAQHLVRYEDRSVEAGRRYGYRLGLSGAEGEIVAGEVWVDVPRAFTLALLGTQPSPGFGSLRAAFTLPVAEPATLELLDLAGRRVVSHEVGGLGEGSHLVDLSPAGRLAAGVYLIRLTQSGRTLTGKAVLID